jgi:hypothetical protein
MHYSKQLLYNNSIVMGQQQSLLNQANELISTGNKTLACGPTCQRKQKEDELKKAYVDSQVNLQTAPEQVTVSAKNYYTYVDGPSGYNKYNKDKVTKTVDDISKEYSSEFSSSLEKAKQLNSDYNSMHNNSLNSEELYNKYIYENTELNENIKKVSSDVFTNGRKTYYEDQQIESLQNWYALFVWMYGIVIVSFFLCIFFVSSDYSLLWKIIYLVLLVIYPFVCTRVALFILSSLKYLYSFLPKNAYI